MEDLKSWIQERYAPKILVVASFEAKAIIGKSNLTPVELLSPFTWITHGFTIQTLNNSINCSCFKLELKETLEKQPSPDILKQNSPRVNWHGNYISGKEDVEHFLRSDPTPWFTAWEEDFKSSLQHMPHELVDMPVGILYIASTTDIDPINTFQTLRREQALPKHYNNKVYDSSVPKMYLLLHDFTHSTLSNEQVVQVYERVQKSVSPAFCQWQVINSAEEPGPPLWGESKGHLISTPERFDLQKIMDDILIKVVVPFVENYMKKLDSVVEQKRRGLKNSLKNFFKKSGDRAETFSFEIGRIEHVSRLLGDLAFVFRDYEMAMNQYRYVFSDFKVVKAWAYAAAASEMMGFCSVFLNSENREIENFFESAYNFYLRADDKMLAIRCGIFMRQVLKALDNNRKLSQKLKEISFDCSKQVPIAYPLFMEQAAIAYLRVSPAYFRKFAFYLVLAGDEYRKLHMVQNALHCYYSAMHIYENKKWSYVDLHINHMLGRFCYYLSMHIEGIYFYQKLIQEPRLIQNTAHYQKKVIGELNAIVSSWTSLPIPPDYNPITQETVKFHTDGKPVFKFSLPRIMDMKLRLPQDKFVVFKEDSSSATSYPWKSLVENSSLSSEFAEFDQPSLRKNKKFYAGESVEVQLSVLNSLQLLCVIEEVYLLVEYEDVPELVDVSVLQRVDIPSRQVHSVFLGFTPRFPGLVKLKGLQWSFGEVFHGVHLFNEETFEIKPACSTVTAQFQGFPETLFQGQIHKFALEITNSELNSVEDVKLVFSHSFLFGSSQVDIGNLEASEQKQVDIWVRGEFVGLHTIKFVLVYYSQKELRYTRLQATLKVLKSLSVVTDLNSSLKEVHSKVLQVTVKKALEGELKVLQISTLTLHSLKKIEEIKNQVFYLGVEEGPENPDILMGEETPVRQGFCLNVKNSLKALHAFQSDPLDLVVFWELECSGQKVKGCHYLLNLQVKSSELPVHMIINAPSKVQHDFQIYPSLKVPVCLHLRNELEEKITFRFDALDTDEPLFEGEENYSPHFSWRGMSSTAVKDLDAGTVKQVYLEAVFSEPGTYNLNRFSFTFSKENFIKQVFSYQHPITIN